MLKRLILVSAATLVLAGCEFERWSLDGWLGVSGGLLVHEDTVYTSGYSDSGFRAVRVGMSLSEVERLIGPPESTWSLADHGGTPNEIGARWSYSPHDTNYRCRVLLLRNGRVYEKHTEFYFD
jgi:hypothetical protein